MDETDAPIAAWDDPAWDVDDEPRPARRSRTWLVAVGVVPWVVVVVLLLRPGTSTTVSTGPAAPPVSAGADPTPGTTAGVTGAVTTGVAGATSEPRPAGRAAAEAGTADGGALLDAWVLTSDARRGPGRGDAVAVAALAARRWLGSAGPPLGGPGPVRDDARYVEHLVLEAVDQPGPSLLVVTLVAVVLPVGGDEVEAATPVRVAVPVHLDGRGAALAGDPWALPAPRVERADVTFQPVDDPELLLAAAAAATRAGYRVDDAVELGRSDTWAWRLILRGTAPGDTGAREQALWLREDTGRFVVAGWLPDGPTTVATPDTTEVTR